MNMLKGYLDYFIYFPGVFGDNFETLPGTLIAECLDKSGLADRFKEYGSKLYQSCSKLCMMWNAGDHALSAHQEFFYTTIREAPALIGKEATNVYYHLEAMVLIARSALDVASYLFGAILPDPFQRKRYDSFNKLVKSITKSQAISDVIPMFKENRSNKYSWLSFVSNENHGRSIRDKVAHQSRFPIGYFELDANSEKESPVVFVDTDEFMKLEDFVNELRFGVIGGFLEMERFAVQSFEMRGDALCFAYDKN